MAAEANFLDGNTHSGYFWADVPTSGGWEDYERAEQQRRVKHEELMYDLFGADQYEDEAIDVELLRDPRSGLEQIAFDIKYMAKSHRA